MKENMEKLFNEIEGTLKGALIQAISESGNDMGKCDPKIASVAASVLNCYVEAKRRITAIAEEDDRRYADMVKFAAEMTKYNNEMSKKIDHLTETVGKLADKVNSPDGKPAKLHKDKKAIEKGDPYQTRDSSDEW